MKMAEKAVMLAFQNNCEAINSNGVEAIAKESPEKIVQVNNDITEIATTNDGEEEDEEDEEEEEGKPEDEPEALLELDVNNASREDAVEDFLAGENKNEFGDDLLLENIAGDNDGIEFKTDNVIMDCPEMEKSEFFEREEDEVEAEEVEDDKAEISSQEEEGIELDNAESVCLKNTKTKSWRSAIINHRPKMPQCAVVGCNSSHRKTKGGSIRYHRFPGDSATRARWVQACGKFVQNCSTARICSRHFTDDSYERDVQHELLGLPTRCRLKKGALPDRNLPGDFLKEDATLPESAIAVLLAVGLVPAVKNQIMSGGLPQDLTKMQIMEDVREGCSVQPSSPGHAEERLTEDINQVKTDENGFDEETPVNGENFDEKQTTDNTDEVKEDKVGVEVQENKSEREHNHVNEESSSNESNDENTNNNIVNNNSSNKRKSDEVADATKRLRMEIQDSFYSRDKLLNDFIELSECSTVEHLQIQTEQILAEIRTLNELAREKEREWNNIIHLKKMKEELLLRMQRRKQVLLLSDSRNENGDLSGESQIEAFKHSSQSILKTNLTNPHKNLKAAESKKHRNILPKPASQQQQFGLEMNGSLDYRQNKQRPILDVQSIIADYRQRHPETVPRRGRRIRNPQNDSKILNFSSLALGSGAQVQHNSQLDSSSELGILLNAMDANCSRSSSGGESSTAQPSEPSFKDMLVQFAKLSQNERHELIQNAIKPPPPYPEVTVHPVPTTTTVAPTNSLLHGILTKSPSKSNTKTSFSPTLARLLTAPERASSSSPTSASMTNNLNNAANMSISEILSTSKARNEITITPVGAQYETPSGHKGKSSQADEDEAEDSADRLVIDESSEVIDARGRGDNSSDTGDEVPQCQGCNQKSALFVCAGCGNQWYCSRDCQVSAWDEHSEVCSG